MADDAHVELAAEAETQHPRLRPATHELPSNPRRRGHGIGQAERATGTPDGDPHDPTALPRPHPPLPRRRVGGRGFPATEIKQRMAQGHCAVWLDLYDPEIDDLAVLTEEFGLHPLAVEDAVHEHERPKLDRYHDHLLLSAYAAELDAPTGMLSTSELAAFITPAALITVRKDDRFDVDALVHRWDDEHELAQHGGAFLLHGLLDLLADGHFTAVQSLDTQVEDPPPPSGPSRARQGTVYPLDRNPPTQPDHDMARRAGAKPR